MRVLFVLCFLFFASSTLQAQIISIPDPNFKMALLDADTTNDIAKDATGNSVVIDTNGDSEIQLAEALVVYELDVSNQNILDITGVGSFTNLRHLNTMDNGLASLDASNLINLISLRSNNNALTNINLAGLVNLEILQVGYNELSTMDMSDLIGLQRLTCIFNNFTSIDTSNLVSLEYCYAQHSNLTSLDMSGSPNLKVLFAFNNALTDLNLTGLTQLESVRCNDNLLSDLDVSDSPGLERLVCNDNSITSLNLNGFSALEFITCQNNDLETLFVEGCESLTEISAMNNSIDVLNLNDCTALETLWVGSNGLRTLLLKNGSSLSDINLFGNSTLEYVCVDEFEVDYMLNQLAIYNIENAEVNTYCTFPPGGEYFTVNGNCRFDFDGNGCDPSDPPVAYLGFELSPGSNGSQFFSNGNGNYVKYLGSGNFTYEVILENPSYFTVSPPSVSVSFPNDPTPFEQDFCLTPNGVRSDMEIMIVPTSAARPGFDADYRLVCRNKGNQPLSGTIELTYQNELMEYITSEPLFDNQTANQFVWNYSNLLPFETLEYDITFNINAPTSDPPVNNGDILTFLAKVEPVSGDETPQDNEFILEQVVVGSFDPNDKTCLQGISITPEEVGDFVHYLIRFENTGTFPAENVVIRDVIDESKLELETFVPVNSSHDFVTRIDENEVEFIFEGINLPFQEGENQGYVLFKIRTNPDLVLGDVFSNSAEIFFDFNFPIVTNTTETEVAKILNVSSPLMEGVTVWPNPSSSLLYVKGGEDLELIDISVWSLLGQRVGGATAGAKFMDVSTLAQGTYFLQITTKKGQIFKQIIKE
ncbi:MAG: T9SS type A sorting domain-containing protein [Bacteroidota bacterium]